MIKDEQTTEEIGEMEKYRRKDASYEKTPLGS